MPANIIPAATGYTVLVLTDGNMREHPIVGWEYSHEWMFPLAIGRPVDNDRSVDGVKLPDGRVYDWQYQTLHSNEQAWLAARVAERGVSA
jgi:hypothetical protein